MDISYKGRTIRIELESSPSRFDSGECLYRYYVDSRKGCSYSTRERAIDAARKYVDRM